MNYKKLILFFTMMFVLFTSISFGGESFTAWAAPFDFTEDWKKIDSHSGEFIYKIIISSEQNYTYLEGEVKYCGPEEKIVTETFQDEIKFRTGDCWANVEVRFRSAPNSVKVNGWFTRAGAVDNKDTKKQNAGKTGLAE